MSRCVIFGGAGYAGFMLAARFAGRGCFDEIVLADLKPSARPLPENVRFVPCDVRSEIASHVIAANADWIFNFASAARESGKGSVADTITRLAGARNICAYAARIGCARLFMGSSAGVYPPGGQPVGEDTPACPADPHGLALLAAELIHSNWARESARRRLIVMRTAPLYGPGGQGEITRLLAAARSRFYVFPGSKTAQRSFAYIHGLLDSIEFMMAREEPQLLCHYADRATETLESMVETARRVFGSKTAMISVPAAVFGPVAIVAQKVARGRTAMHPDEIRELTEPRPLRPALLQHLGFKFDYDFARALDHWRRTAPEEWEHGNSDKGMATQE